MTLSLKHGHTRLAAKFRGYGENDRFALYMYTHKEHS